MRKQALIQRFKNVSIARKLYFTVGLMALLIAIELVVLTFSIKTLSAIRASVTAEGLYSKAQKDAMYQLLKYTISHEEQHYQLFLTSVHVLQGGHMALEQMKKTIPDKAFARAGFIQERSHPDDVDGMYDMFRRFKDVGYLRSAFLLWKNIDSAVLRIIPLAAALHDEINKTNPSEARMKQVWKQIEPLASLATRDEDAFSYTMGEGSRWMENLVLKIVFVVALTVELTGLLLAIAVSRGIQKGLNELLQSSKAVARGDFSRKAKIFSLDEIGILAKNFNAMSDDLQQSIQHMEAAQQKFRSLLDCAPDAMVIVNEQGIIQLVNKQCVNVFGYSKTELVDKKLEMLLSEKYRDDDTNNIIFSNLHDDKTDAIDMECCRKNGEIFPVEISVRPIATDDGFLLSAAIRDISDKKRMENEIREANIGLEKKVLERTSELQSKNEELEQFAYVASHDLQEPLRTTSGFVTLLRKQYYGRLDANADKYINYIISASDRMKTLIMDLLDYSRLGRQKQLKHVDCNSMIDELLVDMEKLIRDNNAVIHVSKLPDVTAYPTELKLLFQNLVSNSIKFKHKGRHPTVHIDARRIDGCWEFSVKDNGIGIEKQYESKIFIIFQRLHNRSQYEGSGIGLAHCKKIVEMHGGQIWVESRPGLGSTFFFTILEN